MDDFLKMDIFFTVATILALVIGALIIVAILSLIRLLKRLERIATEVESEARLLIADVDEARTKIRQEGFKLAHVISLAAKTGKRLITKGR